MTTLMRTVPTFEAGQKAKKAINAGWARLAAWRKHQAVDLGDSWPPVVQAFSAATVERRPIVYPQTKCCRPPLTIWGLARISRNKSSAKRMPTKTLCLGQKKQNSMTEVFELDEEITEAAVHDDSVTN